VMTDGRLRPGHLEVIRVAGFPGKGVTDVSFLPTAICEDLCGSRIYGGEETGAMGAAKFRVRVPNTFFDHRERQVYFRDRERIEVNVTWRGAGDRFAAASDEPTIVRLKRARNG
jgi:hypothetical protein